MHSHSTFYIYSGIWTRVPMLAQKWFCPLSHLSTWNIHKFFKKCWGQACREKKEEKINLKSTKNASYKVHRKGKAKIQTTFLSTCSMSYYLYRKINSSLNLELTDSVRLASKPLRSPISAPSNQIPGAQCLASIMWVLEIQIQVLTFTQQVVYPLSYLPSSVIWKYSMFLIPKI